MAVPQSPRVVTAENLEPEQLLLDPFRSLLAHLPLLSLSEFPATHCFLSLLHLASPVTATSKLGSLHLAHLQSPLTHMKLLCSESMGLGSIYPLILLGPPLFSTILLSF